LSVFRRKIPTHPTYVAAVICYQKQTNCSFVLRSYNVSIQFNLKKIDVGLIPSCSLFARKSEVETEYTWPEITSLKEWHNDSLYIYTINFQTLQCWAQITMEVKLFQFHY